jgi:hypothetical protein
MILHDPAPLGFKWPLARGEYTTANATSCGTASICNRVYGFGLPVGEPIVINYSKHHANSKRSTTPSDETSTKPHHHQRPKRNAPRGSGCRPRWARSWGSRWDQPSGHAPVPRSRDYAQDAFSEGHRSGRARDQIDTAKRGPQLLSSAEQVPVTLRVSAQKVCKRHRRVTGQLGDRIAYHVHLPGGDSSI